MEIIHDSFSEYRNEDRLHYPLHVLPMVIMVAKQYGCQNAQDIADFYNIHYLELFITLPEVPSFKSPISATTIRTAMMLVTPEDTEKFFEEYFTKIKIHIREQIKYNDKTSMTERGIFQIQYHLTVRRWKKHTEEESVAESVKVAS